MGQPILRQGDVIRFKNPVYAGVYSHYDRDKGMHIILVPVQDSDDIQVVI